MLGQIGTAGISFLSPGRSVKRVGETEQSPQSTPQ
jgi:hypothetical protein